MPIGNGHPCFDNPLIVIVMRKHWLIPPVLLAALIVGAALHSPAASAEDVVTRALDGSIQSAALQVGNYTWIEEAGIGVQLPAAPYTSTWPRMLAGRTLDESRSIALYELGEDGFARLKANLEGAGATLAGSEAWPFRPRRYPEELAAQRTRLRLSDGRGGFIVDWRASDRHFAVVAVDAGADAAGRRVDELLRELVQVGRLGPDGIAPLLFQGRYTCVLNGWSQDGERFRRRTQQGWMSLRVFQVSLTEFDSLGRLQLELEARLKDAGFDRSAGMKPPILGTEGFVGEYFGKDGFVQRIAYARLEGGYLIALMQAPEGQRATLGAQMDAFTQSLQSSGLNSVTGPVPLYFTQVRSIRCLAWHDGGRVLWGVLFDDSRQQPVLWRQDGVEWEIRMTRGSEIIRGAAGVVNSSRALNPLVDAETRALELPQDFKGDVELALTIGDRRTTTRLRIE
jgi:hypothetical protein